MISGYGAAPNWQLLSLDQACGGQKDGTIMHELMHAWGFKHEQSRPDRDNYVQVFFDHTNIDSQFALMGVDWIDTVHPYELDSVMHYCSWCGTNGQGPVMTTLDGSMFPAGAFMTTTDSLQLSEYYCANTEYELKPIVQCQDPDKLGIVRPLFLDRVCDGQIGMVLVPKRK